MCNLLQTEKQKRIVTIFSVSLFFIMVTHGYRLANNLYSHDSLVDIVADNIQFQRSLGRFMQVFSILLRGSICNPWIIGLVGWIFFSLSIVIVTDYLGIKSPLATIAVIGVMTSNIVVTTSAAAFLPWLDIYAEALFFAVLGVWLLSKDKAWSYLCGSISIALSMGFYQAYLNVALFLILIYFLKLFIDETQLSVVWTKAGKSIVSFAVAAAIYYALYKGVCFVHHVNVGDSYNSLSQMHGYSGNLINYTVSAYRNFFVYAFGTSGIYAKIGSHTEFWHIIQILSFVGALLLIVYGKITALRKKKRGIVPFLIVIFGIPVFPLVANFVCVLSKNVEHVLMTYAVWLVYVWAIAVWEDLEKDNPIKSVKTVKVIAIMLTVICVWNNIGFSNQLYYRQDIQENAFQAFANRLVIDIESTEDYKYGITPVKVYGSFEGSTYFGNMYYFDQINALGIGKTPVTYMGTFDAYRRYIMNINMNLEIMADSPDFVKEMPSYPEKGSVIISDGAVIVKLSD